MDLELEAQIEVLRDNKRKYQNVIKLAQTLASQLSQIMQTQRQLGDAFADLSLKSPELHVSHSCRRQETGHRCEMICCEQLIIFAAVVLFFVDHLSKPSSQPARFIIGNTVNIDTLWSPGGVWVQR